MTEVRKQDERASSVFCSCSELFQRLQIVQLIYTDRRGVVYQELNVSTHNSAYGEHWGHGPQRQTL